MISMILVFVAVNTAVSQTTAFNYQGKLNDGANPANGNYQMQFRLFDALTDGNQIGEPISDVAIVAAQGIFAVRLDFGATVFTGEDRFLEISVRRNTGENYTTINPRQQIAASPYSIRTLSAAQADLALDSNMLGGIAASEYVTTATVGNSFIRNDTLLQTGNFNINGNGFIGGNLGIGTTVPQSKLSVNTNGYGFTHTNGTVTLGTFLTTGGGWIGMRSNHPLNFFTNDGGAAMQIIQTGEVGFGVTPQAGWKLDVGGNGRFQTSNGNINFGSPNGETGLTFTNDNRADIRFDSNGLKLFAGTGAGIPSNGILITTAGSVGIGTVSPTAKLHVENFSPLGGTAIRAVSNSLFGSAIIANGNVRQNLGSGGLVKAMVYVNSDGSIARCYNGETNSSAGDCGFTITRNTGSWLIDFNFQIDNRFWSGTPGIGVSNVGLQANSVAADTIAVKLFQTDVPNSTGENVFRHFMLIVY